MRKLTILRFLTENTIVSKVVITLGAIFTYLFGDITPALIAIFTLYIIDWITGFTAAMTAGRGVGSRPMLHGFIKTLVYLILISISYQFTKIDVSPIINSLSLMVCGGIQFLIILCESISIVENLDTICNHFKVELPVLKYIAKYLLKNRKKLTEGAK